jgi:hypothetical protein
MSTRTLALVSILFALGCGSSVEPTARFVGAHANAVTLEVLAPAGALVHLGSTEQVVPESGVLRFEEAMTHYSVNPPLPFDIDLRVMPPGLFADEAYVSVHVPLPVETIRALPEDGVVLLPATAGGPAPLAAPPGSSLELAGIPVALDAYGIGALPSNLGPSVLAAPSALADGGGLVLSGMLRTEGAERAVTLSVPLSASAVDGYLQAWIDAPSSALPEGANGTLWSHAHGRREPAFERFGTDLVAARFVVTETVTGTEVQRCQGGFAMIRDTRRVVIRDMASGLEVARRDFVPSGRGSCPLVFTLGEADHHFWTTHAIVRGWIEEEIRGH